MNKKVISFIFLFPLTIGVISCNTYKKEIKYPEFSTTNNEMVDDEDWVTVAGTTRSLIGKGNETYFYNLTSSGQHGYYRYKVHFDGLDISWRAENLPSSSTMSGFYFSSNPNQYYGKPSVAMWKGLYNGQTRVHVGEDHDYNQDSLAYTSPNLFEKGFGVANSMVMSTSDEITHAGFRLRISSYNSNLYALKFNALYADSGIWGNNANYSKDDGSATVYLPKETVNCLDSNGDCYIQFFGFDTNAIQSNFIPYIDLVDDNIRNYRNTYVAPVIDTLNEYVNKMNSATNTEDFKSALEYREYYLTTLGNLRKHDQYIYAHEKLEEADASVAPIAAKFAHSEIKKYFDIVENDLASLKQEENVIEENLMNYRNNVIEAKESFEKYRNLLLEEQKQAFLSSLDNYEYQDHFYSSLLWVLTFERMMDKVNASNPNVANLVDEIRTYYEKDEARDNINQLKESDKASITQRIQNDKERLDGLYVTYRKEIISSFLSEWNNYLNQDLTNKNNLVSAINYYHYITSRITVSNNDDAYKTYQTYFNKMVDASDNYILSTINLILSLYKEDIVMLNEYNDVKNTFRDFDIETFLFTESSKYNDLINQYNSLKEKVTSSALYYFDDNGVSNAQLGKNGLYFDSPGNYPSRLNYNEGLSISSDIDIEMIVEEYAFFNDGTKANNISFNFLNTPNSYKGEVGISFVLWVYEKNCNLKLYNLVDGEIGSCSITTPKVGEPFHITLKEINNEYIIGVNDGEIKVTDEYLSRCGIDLNDTVYFSIGSFLDDKTYCNSFSIRKVNEHNFYQEEPIIKEDNPDMK